MARRIETMNIFFSVLNNLEGNGINVTTKYEDNFPKLLTKHLKKGLHYMCFIVVILN